jgi:hypothetical protein
MGTDVVLVAPAVRLPHRYISYQLPPRVRPALPPDPVIGCPQLERFTSPLRT